MAIKYAKLSLMTHFKILFMHNKSLNKTKIYNFL